MFFVPRVALVILVLSLLLLVSCGGHSGTGSSDSKRGIAQFTIQWPEKPTRLIPAGSGSIKVNLTGAKEVTQTVARPPAGTNTSILTFPDLPEGSYIATATAYPAVDGTGIAQAEGTTPLELIDNQTTQVGLTMESTITSISITMSGDSKILLEESRQLRATALNSQNQIVLVPDSHWEWTNNTPSGCSLTPTQNIATIESINSGEYRISVRETESQKSHTIAIQSPHVFIQLLGDLPGGRNYSGGMNISANGKYVVGISESDRGNEAFIWDSRNGMTGLGYLPGQFFASGARDVSDDGNVVVGEYQSTANLSEAFRWRRGSGLFLLGILAPGTSAADAVSADGSVIVGTTSSPLGSEAFRWTQATGMVGLGDLSPTDYSSSATDVSADGSVIVGIGTTGVVANWPEGFYWTASTGMVPIGSLSQPAISSINAVSRDGKTIIGADGLAPSAVVTKWEVNLPNFQASVLTPSGLAPFTGASVEAISQQGEVIVGQLARADSYYAAHVWRKNGTNDFLFDILTRASVDLSQWSDISTIHGVSADGKFITGSGIFQGNVHAFRAYKSDGFQIR